MKYYIASPGFNPTQLAKIKSIEAELDRLGADYYSPFKNGDNLHIGDDMDLNKIQIKHIFDKNIEEINSCDKMIAIVEDFDKGTAFEIGYFAASRGLDSLNRSLLLIGELSEEVAKVTEELIKSSNLYKLHPEIDCIDITEKNLETYIHIGLSYGLNRKVVTYSSEPLESNVMTACATYVHFTEDGTYGSFNKFRNEFIKDQKGEAKLTLGKLFSLSPIKFFTKVE